MSEHNKQPLNAPDLFDRLRTRHTEVSSITDNQQTADSGGDIESDTAQAATVTAVTGKGRLSHAVRKAVVSLLRHGVIHAEQKRLLFETLCQHQLLIKDHLADMYLHMLLDEQAGIAILLQQEAVEDNAQEEVSALIIRRTLSLYDTLLILVLRKHYQERESAGEQRVIIDIEQVETGLTPFLPLTNSSRSDRRQLSGALKHMKDRRILNAVRGEEDRFEITPVIRYVVNAVFLEHMLSEYQKLLAQTGNTEELNNE